MDSSKCRLRRVLLYFVLISLFLFVSGHVGQYLIEHHGLDRELGLLLQGVIFTGLTLIVLYILKRKNPDVLKNIGLKGADSLPKFIVGVLLPLLLLGAGIFTAYLFGGIENIRLNLTTSVITAIFINTVTAFLYEAFPEEIFLRGLIFEELHKKLQFIFSLFVQVLIFICVPIFVMTLSSIFFHGPFSLTIDYFILLFTFGIALQLYKKYTGTLWMSIIFHVIYLEVTRYVSSGGMYDANTTLLQFDETFGGFMMLYLSFLFIVVLSVVVLSILLLIDNRKNRRYLS